MHRETSSVMCFQVLVTENLELLNACKDSSHTWKIIKKNAKILTSTETEATSSPHMKGLLRANHNIYSIVEWFYMVIRGHHARKTWQGANL
jgi:hypothetical protein